MKINHEQLDQALKRLYPIFLINGGETLFVNEAIEKIRLACQQQNISERESYTINTHFNWSEFILQTTNFSLFSQRKLIELWLPAKLTNSITEGLSLFLEKKSGDDIVIISCEKIEAAQQRSAWFNKINQLGLYIQIFPLAAQQFPNWIKQRLKNLNLTADDEAIALISERTQGNLLAAKQEIEKLALTFGQPHHLNLNEIVSHGTEQGQYDIFTLVDSCLQKETKKTLKIFDFLQASGAEATLVLWAICRELRQLISAQEYIELQGYTPASALQKIGTWEKRKPLLQKYLQACKLKTLYSYLQKAANIDRLIKGVQAGNVWQELLHLCLLISEKKDVL